MLYLIEYYYNILSCSVCQYVQIYCSLSKSPPSTTLSRTARQGQRMSTLSLSPLIFLLAASPPRASIALSLALALSFSLRLCVEVLINPAAGRRQRNCLPTCRQKTSSPPHGRRPRHDLLLYHTMGRVCPIIRSAHSGYRASASFLKTNFCL